ncbi:3'-5' exonuclease domain-containing protein [Plasmodiophora brassicae]
MLLAFRRRCRCWCRLQTTLAGEGTPTSTAGVIVSDGLWPAPYDVIQWTGPHAVEFCTALATRTKQNPFVAAHAIHLLSRGHLQTIDMLEQLACSGERANAIAMLIAKMIHGAAPETSVTWSPSRKVSGDILDDRHGLLAWMLQRVYPPAFVFLGHHLKRVLPSRKSQIRHWIEVFYKEDSLPLGARLDGVASVAKQAPVDSLLEIAVNNLVDDGHRGYARLICSEIQAQSRWMVGMNILTGRMKLGAKMHQIFVDSDEFLDLAENALKKHEYVGVDTETKPAHRKGVRHPVAIVQIATERSVFVFDLLVKDTRLRRRMMAVVADVLSNKDIVKLGVAVKGDIVGLAKCYKPFDIGAASVVDLNDIFMDLYPGATAKSLRRLVVFCFGMRLGKAQQMSDWSARPLSQVQLHYACLDAYVAIPVARRLIAMGEGSDAPFLQCLRAYAVDYARPVPPPSSRSADTTAGAPEPPPAQPTPAGDCDPAIKSS